jgi:hypothetical protein
MKIPAPVDVTSHPMEWLSRRVLDLKCKFAFELLSIVNRQINWCPNYRKPIMVFERMWRFSMRVLAAKDFNP